MPLFQNESKCERFHMKMSSACWFIFIQISHFHENGFALRLALKQRHKGTRKWPIEKLFLGKSNYEEPSIIYQLLSELLKA